jgi:hypothetical protein
MKPRILKLALLSALAMTAILSGCTKGDGYRLGATQTESKTVELGGAKSVQAELKMAAGDLKISGGSANLMNASFKYNVPEWKPEVSYTVEGTEGRLEIEQPGHTHTNIGGVHYSWDLHLNNNVPMELSVEMGAGNSELNLNGLSLTRLDVQVGAGNADVDLTGDWKHNLSVSIEGGVGQASISLPQEVGVRANVQGGLGSISAPGFKKDGDSYVNDAYGKSPVSIELNVQGGIGQVNLKLVGSRPVV